MESLTDLKYINEISFKHLVNWSASLATNNSLNYKDAFQLLRIGDLLIKNNNKVNIEDQKYYKRVTIKLYGKGVLERDEVKGSSIGVKRQFLVSPGQFIMSKIDARNGAFGLVPESLDKAITTQDFLSYTINKGLIIPEFFLLLTGTKQFHNLCQRASSGTTGRQRIDETSFLNFRIPIPNLEEQKRFVSEYKSSFNLGKNQFKQAEKLQNSIAVDINAELGITRRSNEMDKGLNFIQFKDIDKWGVDFIFNTIYSNDNFPVKKLNELCKIGSGGTPSRSFSEYYNGNILWVKTGELNDDVIFETEEKITLLGLQSSNAKLYPKGSILLAMYGATIGKTAKLGVDAATNQACAVLHGFNSTIVVDFLWFYLQSQVNVLRSMAYGSAQPNINAQIVGNFEIPIPPISKQDEMVKFIKERKSRIKQLFIDAENNVDSALQIFESSIFK